MPVVRCSNFIGDALDIAAAQRFEQVLLAGHIGKLVKVAAGIMNTHSRQADCRTELFCAHAAVAGASTALCRRLLDAATTDACIPLLDAEGLRDPVLSSLTAAIQTHLERRAAGAFAVGALLFSNQYGLLGLSPQARTLIDQWRHTMHEPKGVLYGVSVGPGDPELLTLKALRTIQACPVVAAPRTKGGGMVALDIARQAADLSGKEILPLDFSMSPDPAVRAAAHAAAAQLVRARLDAGQDVAMLNLGDVSIYATCSYLIGQLRAQGYATARVAGGAQFLPLPPPAGREPHRYRHPSAHHPQLPAAGSGSGPGPARHQSADEERPPSAPGAARFAGAGPGGLQRPGGQLRPAGPAGPALAGRAASGGSGGGYFATIIVKDPKEG